MENKTILVSGANGNLGNAVVQYFLSKGWQVAGLVHRSTMPTTSVKNYLEFEVDLTNEEAVERCLEEAVLKRFSKVDIAVLTAGGFTMGNLEQTDAQAIQQQIQLNFSTTYNVVRPLLKIYKKQNSGKFFFTGSMQGLNTAKGKAVVAYSLSKSLLFQLANIVNVECRDTNISAQVIVPSTIDTPQNRKDMPDADFSKWEKPEVLAAVILQHFNKPFDNNHVSIVIQEELKKIKS